MNKLYNIIISVSGGGGTAIMSWETFYNAIVAIMVGLCVTVGSFLIIHEIQKYWKRNKK